MFALFATVGAFVGRTAWLSYRHPREAWNRGRGRWMTLASVRRGGSPPSESEVRFWAAVWLVIACAGVALGLAIALVGEP